MSGNRRPGHEAAQEEGERIHRAGSVKSCRCPRLIRPPSMNVLYNRHEAGTFWYQGKLPSNAEKERDAQHTAVTFATSLHHGKKLPTRPQQEVLHATSNRQQIFSHGKEQWTLTLLSSLPILSSTLKRTCFTFYSGKAPPEKWCTPLE